MSPRRLAVVGLSLVVMASGAWSQDRDTPEDPELGPQRILDQRPFLGRFDESRYDNYGAYDYPRQVGITSNLRNLYSNLGDPLVYGSQSVAWVERRGLGIQRLSATAPFISGLDASQVSETAVHGESGASFPRLFNKVVVGTDGTDSWQARAIWANEIRTRLTPLTFKMSNLDGLRIDWATENNSFSAIFSPLNPSNAGVNPFDSIIFAKSLMLGGHYERRLGFLNLGATYVNAHQYEPLMGNKSQSLQGVAAAIQGSPALLAIRISDDSPGDGQGPVLHGVRVLVNGEEVPANPFIVLQNERGDNRQSYVSGLLRSGERRPLPPKTGHVGYQSINRRSGNTYDPYINYAAFDAALYFRGLDYPFWIDHLFYRDYKLYGEDHVVNPDYEEANEVPVVVHEEWAHELADASGTYGFATTPDLPQSFDGDWYGILYVDLEPIGGFIESVDVQLDLSGDYRVELSQVDMAGTAPAEPSPNYRDRYRYASFFRTVARATGNPKGAHVKRVTVNAGTPTGLSLYSANAYGVYMGFDINAEFARSASFYQYASGEPAPRVSREALSVQGRLRETSPGKRSTVDDKAYYITVTREFERFGMGGEVFHVGPLYNTEFRNYVGRDELDLSGNPLAFNNVILHRLVEDNDDDDRYPDSWYDNFPTQQQGQSDVDGIFPGLDEDSDGIPDTNKNLDAQPDYVEPFLMYMSDPQLYDYGLDLNHNDYIDARENDIKPDYPYDLNLRGVHLYGTLKLAPGLGLTLGLMNGEQVAGGAPSQFAYGRLRYKRRVPGLGRYFTEATVEKVEDGVADDLSVYSDRALTLADEVDLNRFAGYSRGIVIAPFLEEPWADPLLFKNSWWYRLYIDTQWATIADLNIRNKVKFEINDQQEGKVYDGTFQAGDRLTRMAMVHKIDYTWSILPRLSLFSAYKVRYRKEWQESLSATTANELHSIPIARLTFHLTERTKFQLGMQGITSLLPYSVRDLARPELDFKQRDTVLMMTNTSRYFGYIVSMRAGVNKRIKDYEEEASAATGDEDFVGAFIHVVIGFADEIDY